MAGTLDVGTLLAHIGVDTTKLKKADKAVDGFTKNTEKKMGKAEKATNKVGAAITALASAAAATALIRMSWGLVQSASDLEEATGKFETVFRGVANTTNWVKELQSDFAMSEREAKVYLGNIQDLLVPMGMNRKAAAGLSKEITKLSADLGSFNNLPTQKVMEDIQSGLVGNYETMKKYGIMLNATTVEQKALNMGLVENKKELTYAQKALAAYTIMIEGSGDAIGDYARTKASFANVLKDTKAKWEDLRNVIGNEFLPVANSALVVTRDLILQFQNNKKEILQLITGFGTLIKLAAVGGGLYALPKLFMLTRTAIAAANAQLILFNVNLGVIAKTTSLLFAGFAGWSIGTWLSDQFETARLAGISFVDGSLKAAKYLEHGVKFIWVSIKTSWLRLIKEMKEVLADFLDSISLSLSEDIPFNIPIIEAMAGKVKRDADELRDSIKRDAESFREAEMRLKAELEQTLKTHDKIIDELISAALDKDYGKKGGIAGDPEIEKRMKESAAAIKAVMDSLDADSKGTVGKGDIGERKTLEAELNAQLKALTMERLKFFDWETSEKLAKLKSSYGEESNIYQSMAKIRIEERKAVESEVNQIIADSVEDRLQLIDSLNIREIRAAKNQFEVRKYSLEREKELFENKYGHDAEVLKEFMETYRAELAKIDIEYKAYLDQQKNNTKGLTEEMKNMFSGWGNSFSSTLNDMLWGAEINFRKIAQEFAKMITQMMIQKALLNAAGSLTGGGGWISTAVGIASRIFSAYGGGSATALQSGAAGISNSGMYSTGITMANGGILPGGFQAFANGGVVKSPTFGLVGEGKYNEAVIPLPDGKNVPVKLLNGSGGGTTIINVTVESSGGNKQADEEQGLIIAKVVEIKVKEMLITEKRHGGMLYAA